MTDKSVLHGRTILLVEDEMMVAMLLETVLEDAGCMVICSGFLEEAMLLARDRDLDAAVLDVNLHGKRSYPVADALAARGVPFVFATGYGVTDLRTLYPGRQILTKPYEAADLIEALSIAVSTASGGAVAAP